VEADLPKSVTRALGLAPKKPSAVGELTPLGGFPLDEDNSAARNDSRRCGPPICTVRSSLPAMGCKGLDSESRGENDVRPCKAEAGETSSTILFNEFSAAWGSDPTRD